MFDLDREVNEWCNSVKAGRCRRNAGIDELKDHLYCEVERLQSEGKSAEKAFRAATARIEANDALGLVAKRHTNKERHMRVTNSIIWAALIIASALVLKGANAEAGVSQYLLIVVFIPLWYAADQLLLRAMKQRSEG